MKTIKMKTIGVVLFSCLLMTQGAQAEDVYNFYFQKSGDKKQDELPNNEQAVLIEEPREEIVEVPNDVLLVPDNWQPAQSKKKKVYVRRRDLEKSGRNEVRTSSGDEDSDSNRSGWSVNLGVGGFSAESYTYLGEVTQKTYVIGARYHMSKYFDVNGEFHIANGDYEANGYSIGINDSFGPQALIGLGVTPIHLDIFGGEFLEIGVDGGVMFGDRGDLSTYSRQVSASGNSLYLGPRAAVKFGDHLSMVYAYKKDLDSDTDFSVHSLSLAYRW